MYSADPNAVMPGVEVSETEIQVEVTVPATITFDITNDDVSVELDEVYSVTMIPNDPNVFIEERMATIVIVDDVDSEYGRYESLSL